MDKNPFHNKEQVPGTAELIQALGETHACWEAIRLEAIRQYPRAAEEWYFPGLKYGWCYRLKDRKRALLYLLPREGFFFVAFVFGEAATQKILRSSLSESIRSELSAARPYAEGRGIRIAIYNDALLGDISELIRIKTDKTKNP